MQAIGWYAHRLRSMSAPEVWWRLRSKAQEAADRWLAFWLHRPLAPAHFLDGVPDDQATTGVAGAHLAVQDGASLVRLPADALNRLIRQADDALANRLDLFDLSRHPLGETINWNYEYKAGKPAPMDFAPTIDYRDHAVTGDCKFVWEVNRHHQLVVLGRAYRATGDHRYAQGAADMLRDWIVQCPYGRGMNWRSPLELGIRLINWVWALELIEPAGVIDSALRKILLESAYRHLHDITRKYSQYSSANNHLVGEAAGVLIGSAHFSGLRGARRWREESKAILEREILAQNFPDGANREQAVGYHLFVTQFFLFAGLAGRNIGDDFSEEYWSRLERMFEFAAAIMEAGDPGAVPPMFGDADDGYVLDLGGRDDVWRAYIGLAGRLMRRADFTAIGQACGEPTVWALGEVAAPASPDAERRLTSRAFAHAGYYLLQFGRVAAPDRISVVFDCGPLGFKSIAAHGHADALSFTLRAFGTDVLVDPGTYDYFSYGPWRNYFRSTRAHNTVLVDGQDQSELQGSFLWGRKAEAHCIEWLPTADGGRVAGEHDGYRHLDDPVTHRRTVVLRGTAGCVGVEDEFEALGRHELTFCWHFAEDCLVREVEPGAYEVDCGKGLVRVQFDPRLKVMAWRGSEDPRLGWMSRGYHRKVPTTTLVAEGVSEGPTRFHTEFRVLPGYAAGSRGRD